MKTKIATKTILIISALLILFKLPILHQKLITNTNSTSNITITHFSIYNAISTDISEHQLQTPYFVYTTIKDNLHIN